MSSEAQSTTSKLVSVICRSIGRPELEQSLSSIANQNYPAIEIILVEASAESLSPFKQFADSTPITLISTGNKLSRSAAANAGLGAATGDYLMFLDDDDWISEDHIQNLVEVLDNQSSALAAYSGTQKVSADGKDYGEVFGQEFDPQLLMRDNYIPIHSMLFSSSLLGHGCRFDDNFDIFEDWDFWLQLSQLTQFVYVPKTTAYYRGGGESETASENDSDRYSSANPRGQGRAKLFAKWLKIWNGEQHNQLLGSLDQSATIDELNKAIAALHESVAASTAHNEQLSDSLRIQNDQVRDYAEKLALEIEKHQQTQKQLSEEITRHHLRIEEKDQQLDSLHQHTAELDRALNLILRSSSWKLTGPYRRIGRLIKRLMGRSAQEQALIAKGTLPENSVTGDEHTHPLTCTLDRAVTVNGFILIKGWAIQSPAIESIQLLTEDDSIPVIYGLERVDIEEAFPTVPRSRFSGFLLFAQVSNVGKTTLLITDTNGLSSQKVFSSEPLKDPALLLNSGEFVGLDLDAQYDVYRTLQSVAEANKNTVPSSFDYSPLISIIVPVYNVKKRWLDACVNSVLKQSYENWELCLHDDASTDQETLDCLRYWEKQDSRIKVQFGVNNQHISGASNSALEIANGEFIGLMDNDDELAADALWHVVEALNKDPDIDYIYTDEDKIDETGRYCEPHFKPGWSPETLESMMYIGHFGVIRKSIIDEVGGFRIGVEGSQDFDLTLRISQITQKFTHIPKVLYHWRIIPGSVSGGGDAKNYAYPAAIKALTDHVSGEGSNARVSETEFLGRYRVQRDSGNPSVTIILPFHNKADMTIDCLKSIDQSTYRNFTILLISNNSDDSQYEIVAQYANTHDYIDLRKLDIPFNWSAINNWGIKQSTAEFVLFLNNDMEVINPDWIESLLDCAVKEQVGAVGGKLLFEDNTIQHAGIIMQLGGIASHAFKNLDDQLPGYFGYASVIRNCSAVTGACMLVRKSIAETIGGFNEDLRVSYNDVDFCLRLREKGLKVLYTPFAKLYHYESKTRPKLLEDMSSEQLAEFETESAYIRKRHPQYFENGDPYYNPSLSLRVEDYSLNI